MLIDELKAGNPVYKTVDEVLVLDSIIAPTSKELRAVREIARLEGICQGLIRANESLSKHMDDYLVHLAKARENAQATGTADDFMKGSIDEIISKAATIDKQIDDLAKEIEIENEKT